MISRARLKPYCLLERQSHIKNGVHRTGGHSGEDGAQVTKSMLFSSNVGLLMQSQFTEGTTALIALRIRGCSLVV